MHKCVQVGMVCFFLLLLVACTGAMKQSEVDPWLRNMAGQEPPRLELTGKWRDAKGNAVFGWGEGYLRQHHNQLEGVIGNYNLKGRIAGDRVYLVFISGGAVYYTARLEMLEEGLLSGNYYDARDKAQENGYPTMLERTSHSLR